MYCIANKKFVLTVFFFVVHLKIQAKHCFLGSSHFFLQISVVFLPDFIPDQIGVELIILRVRNILSSLR